MARLKLVEILPGKLYTRGQLPDWAGPSDLASVGVTLALSLTARGEPGLAGWGGYLHLPMSDGADQQEDLAGAASRRVVNEIVRGGEALVMCHAGRNRTGLVVCLALRRLLKVSGSEALDFFRARRPMGVANQAFETYLRSLS